LIPHVDLNKLSFVFISFINKVKQMKQGWPLYFLPCDETRDIEKT